VARRKLATFPPNFLPMRSKSIAASSRPMSVGTMTIARIIATELRNDVQNVASDMSSVQFSSPIHSGGRMPR
jgi:hypothetical protein